MKIISSFKDFYDFSPQMLGFQPDPVPMYLRDTIPYKADIDFTEITIEGEIAELNEINRTLRHLFHNIEGYEFSIIAVCGTGYLTAIKGGKNFYISDDYKHKFDFFDFLIRKRSYYEAITEDIHNIYTVLLPEKLSLLIGAPVYRLVIDKTATTQVAKQIPMLQKYGLGKILDPNKLYQDIEYWLTSVLSSSPDTVPPVEVANEYKITAAGFDLKESFRNTKK